MIKIIVKNGEVETEEIEQLPDNCEWMKEILEDRQQ